MRKLAAALALFLLSAAPAWAQATNGIILNAVTGGQNLEKVLALPSAMIPIGQGTNSDPQALAISGDGSLSMTGALSITKTVGTPFGTAATVNTGVSGATVPLNNGANVFSGLNTFTGHVAGGTSPPVLSSCGTTPAILGDDKDGQVTMGTGSPTGCVITFAGAYTATPMCVVTWQATPLASQSYTVTNTAITTVQTATSSNKLNYHCAAQNGG